MNRLYATINFQSRPRFDIVEIRNHSFKFCKLLILFEDFARLEKHRYAYVQILERSTQRSHVTRFGSEVYKLKNECFVVVVEDLIKPCMVFPDHFNKDHWYVNSDDKWFLRPSSK